MAPSPLKSLAFIGFLPANRGPEPHAPAALPRGESNQEAVAARDASDRPERQTNHLQVIAK